MNGPLFDTHCHLDFPTLAEERVRILDAAREAGVRRLVSVGAGRGLDSAPAALALAREEASWIRATAGLHPHDARLLDDEASARLEALAGEPEVVAIGETGLDYHYDNSPRADQREAFRWSIDLARRVSKPIVVHTREAAADTLAILREENAREVGGIIHCFSEDAPFAKAALELGFVSSFSGIVSFKNARAVHEAARVLPDEAVLVETDAPFLAPVPHRGKRNEPAYVAHTAEALAALRGVPFEELCRTTYENGCRVYGLDLEP